jgi:hypothetical protein
VLWGGSAASAMLKPQLLIALLFHCMSLSFTWVPSAGRCHCLNCTIPLSENKSGTIGAKESPVAFSDSRNVK